MTLDVILEIAGTVVGLLYLYYEYKASSMLWIMGAIMPALSLAVYYNAGLYADFGINIYYLLAAIYGFVAWARHRHRYCVEMPVTTMPLKKCFPALLCGVGVFILIYYVLSVYTDSDVPAWDSLTTALSIIAMWMLARKYVEQWLAWIIVDAVSVGLYIYKDIYFYAALYFLYTIIAIFGYFKWKKLIIHECDRPF